MHIMAAFTDLFGTDSSCLQVRNLKGFIYSADYNICLNTICIWMNSWSHNRIQDIRATESKMAS